MINGQVAQHTAHEPVVGIVTTKGQFEQLHTKRFHFVSTPAAMMAVRMHAKRNGLTLRFANGTNDEERRARSAAMRDQGYSLNDIAIELAWSDGGAAQRGIERYERAQALKKMTKRGGGG